MGWVSAFVTLLRACLAEDNESEGNETDYSNRILLI